MSLVVNASPGGLTPSSYCHGEYQLLRQVYLPFYFFKHIIRPAQFVDYTGIVPNENRPGKQAESSNELRG